MNMPLVLVPGLLCDALLWQPQVAGLGDVADTWIADHTRSETLAGVAADILSDAPFDRFALAGLSMGGYIAFEIWRQAPERVLRLGLFDTSARSDTPSQAERRLGLIEMAARGRFIGVASVLLPLLVHADRLSDPALIATVKTMARKTGSHGFIRQQRAVLSRVDSRPDLPRIQCPTLVLCGRDDAMTPLDRHEEMAAGIHGARLRIVERCGHLSTLEQPDVVNKAMREWLLE
ncbi:MAG: alpha/beta fold hydrolase [Burkholderiales bacterium]